MTAAESFDSPLRIAVRRDGPRCIIELAGAASMDEVAGLEQRLGEVLATGATELILDFARLAFINSPGIGAIVAAHNRARAQGGALRIAQANRNVDRMLRLTHLDQVIPLHATLAEALAAS